MDELEEVGRTADAIRADLESAFVRGLATSTPNDRKGLVVRTETWEKAAAHHVATRLRAALRAADADAKDAAQKFLSAYTSLHAFERVLSLEVAKLAWAGRRAALDAEQDEDEEAKAAPVPAAQAQAPATMPIDDPKGAADLTTELAKLIEDLVRTGLTSATAATRTKLDAAFKEASRRKLLRLGASLRYVNEEVGRFLSDDGSFASRRYAFFLHRSWLLARGTKFALTKGDTRLVASLSAGGGPPPKPVGTLGVVTIGIQKRVTASLAAFDFRLRVITSPTSELLGKALVFSLVFARKAEVPAEAYLHLPQPQKYAPKLFRNKTVITVTDAAMLPDDRGGGRLVLGPKSTVTEGKRFDGWGEHYGWDPDGAEARVLSHAPSPLDLAVEMQEEVVLDDFAVLPGPEETLRVHGAGLSMRIVLPSGDAGKELQKELEAGARKKKKQAPHPLFGTVHYEFGDIVFSPLSFLEEDGPRFLTLSDENINLAALLGSLNL
ncbi:MAG: hypothetical protein HOV80_17320 [Polyangiaceae bacterium]|nr:hypothetical protein [Polyangiaceae bacterium]